MRIAPKSQTREEMKKRVAVLLKDYTYSFKEIESKLVIVLDDDKYFDEVVDIICKDVVETGKMLPYVY